MVGCASPPPAAEPAAVPEPPPAVIAEAEQAPTSAQLLTEYGELLLAAATTGGDALERTLAVTADDRELFDPDCAPHWAHEILALPEEGGPEVPIETTSRTLTVGAVEVPVAVRHERLVHLAGAPCDQRLPQPQRETATAAPTISDPSAAEPEPEPEREPAQAPEQPAPSPRAATPSPPPAQPPTHEPVPKVSGANDNDAEDLYDADVADWSVVFEAVFNVAVEGRRWFGQVGGGQQAADVNGELGQVVGDAVVEFASPGPPASRADTNEVLLDGLGLWQAELNLLRVCAISPRRAECDEIPQRREAWQQQLAVVGQTTGTAMPSGHLTMPARGLGDSANPPPHGQWNIGDIRVPTEFEVRRSLE